MLNGKTILITGGMGFIGSHMVDRLLNDGHRVMVLDNLSTGRPENLAHHQSNNNLEIAQVDISDIEAIKPHFKGVDLVFHLAALADIVPSIVNPLVYYKSNVLGTVNVVEAARLSEVKKVIYAASSSCYGIPDVFPTSESAEIRSQYPYALTKYLGEQTVLHWGQVYKIPVVSLRLFNVYGPRARTSGTYGAVLGVFLAQKIAGNPLTIVGDGTQERDFIYVTDVADAFVKAAFYEGENDVFNVGSDNPQSVNKLASLIGGEKTSVPKRPGEPQCTWADITKIKTKLHWQPQISLEEGVALLLEDIGYWRDAPVWTPEKIEVATKDWFKYLSEE